MPTLKVYLVRHTKTWEDEWVAFSREEALERSEDYHISEGYLVETSSHTTARPIREATPGEVADYLPEQ